MIIPLASSNGVKQFLTSNPFLYVNGKYVYRALFIDPEVPASKEKLITLIKQTKCKGLAKTNVYCFGHVDEMTDWIEENKLKDVNWYTYDAGDEVRY